MDENKRYSRVYVEITNICNRSCSFCPGTKRPPIRLTRAQFSHILDELNGLTEYIYLHVMGEPLTHPELAELVTMGTSRGFKVAITTNGTLLADRGASLLTSGLYKLSISLHSFEQGTLEEHLAYLSECMDFADRASSAGILTVFRLWNRGCDGGRNIDTLDLLRSRFSDCEWREGASGYRIRHRLHLEYGDRFEWPDAAADELGDRVFCHGLGDHFGILSDGRVVPCCLDREAEIELGNIFRSPVREILSSERARAITEGFGRKCAVEDLCQRCGYARRFRL